MAVDDMYTKVAENWLEDRLDPLQKEFLEKTLDYYEKFTGFAASDPGRAAGTRPGLPADGRHPPQARPARRVGAGLPQGARRSSSRWRPGRDSAPDARRALAATRTRLGDLLFRLDRIDQAEGLVRPGGRGPGADGRRGRTRPARTAGCWPGPSEARPSCSAARATSLAARPVAGACRRPPGAGPQGRSPVRRGPQRPRAGGRLRGQGRARPGRRGRLRARLPPGLRAARSPGRRLPHRAPLSRGHGAVSATAWANLERETGRPAECEAHWRRMLAEAERLAQDFPDRPEYRRLLAGGHSNVGGILAEQDRFAEAEPILRRGIELNTELLAKSPTTRRSASTSPRAPITSAISSSRRGGPRRRSRRSSGHGTSWPRWSRTPPRSPATAACWGWP